jgi:hypothetical protein
MTATALSNRPIGLCGVIVALAIIGAISGDDPSLTLACGLVTALAVGLLWRLGEAPAILMAAGMQLSQVIMPVVHANLAGVPLQVVSLHPIDPTSAIWFALASMLSLVVGLWCGQLKKQSSSAPFLLREAKSWSVRSAFIFCIITLSFSAVFEVLSGLSETVRQPFLTLSSIQWLGVFVLATVCIAQSRGFGLLLLVISLEVVKGITGYFSDFKMVFLVLFVAVFSARQKLKPGLVVAGLAVGGVALTLGAFWSATKGDYRSFASGHSVAQIIVVPFEDRLNYLMNKLYETNWTTMSIGFERLAQRIGYVDYLAATMRNVPSHLPYQNGALIGASVMHVVEPRFLFPDKPILEDKELTSKYAGVRFDNPASSGTSISLGYLAELYIDFGISGAIVACFVLGFLGGRCFRIVFSSTYLPTLVSSGLAVTLATSATLFETSLPKTIGSFVLTLAVILVLRRSLLPTLLRMFGPSDFDLARRSLQPDAIS